MFGLDTCLVYDMSVMKDGDVYRMWYSVVNGMIAHASSVDGVHWTDHVTVLTRVPGSAWQDSRVSRPRVIKKDGLYHMWYIGHIYEYNDEVGCSSIGYGTSMDGIHWDTLPEPVMTPEFPWEQRSLFCPFVIWEEES